MRQDEDHQRAGWDRLALADLLGHPYHLAVAPSPRGDVVAVAVINGGPDPGGVGVALVGPDGSMIRRLHDFGLLLPVSITWDTTGRSLALAQANVLCYCRPEGQLRHERFDAGVRWAGFDTTGRCWCLSGTQLMVAEDQSSPFTGHRSRVLAADVRAGLVTVTRREGSGDLQVSWSLPDGASHTARWPLEVTENPAVRWAYDGSAILVAAERWQAAGRLRAQIGLLHPESPMPVLLFDEVVATGIITPRFEWAPLDGTTLGVLADLGEMPRFWEISPAQPGGRSAVSAPGDEVFSFAVHPGRQAIALVVSGTSSAQTATERRLVAGWRTGNGWRLGDVAGGINDLPGWARSQKRLFFVHGGPQSTHLGLHCHPGMAVRSGTATTTLPAPPRCSEASVRGVPAEVVEIGYAAELTGGDTGVVYVQGPHRQLLTGPQTTFFHHAIYCLLQALGSAGHRVVAVNGPGSTGRGTARRQHAVPYPASGVAVIEAAVEHLRRQGCQRYAILAGSLGAMAALRFLTSGQECAAAALVSPVYVPAIAPLRRWQAMFAGAESYDDPDTTEVEAALGDLAARIVTPLAIVHGQRDEVTPAYHTSAFAARLPVTTPCRVHVLPDEVHIFQRLESWSGALLWIGPFLDEALGHQAAR